MLNHILFLLHTSLLLMMYLGCIFPKKYATYVFVAFTLIIYSWLVFDGCIINDIEAAVSPKSTNTGSLCMRLANMCGIDMDKHEGAIKKINDVGLLISYLGVAWRAGRFNDGVVLLSVYIVINGGVEGKGWKLKRKS